MVGVVMGHDDVGDGLVCHRLNLRNQTLGQGGRAQRVYDHHTFGGNNKTCVADEVLVSVVQAGGSMQERQELAESFDRANTPDQLLGVIETAHELMAGQLESLALQYESSVGEKLAKRNPFVDKLSPKTRKLFDQFRIGADTESKRPKKEQVGFSLENPKPEDKQFVDMYLKDRNSTTGKQIEKALIQRGYKIEENL
jgi:hypothetical protein